MHNVPRLDGQAMELPDGTSWSAVDRDTYSHYPLVCAPGSVGGRWYVALDDDRGRLPGAFDPDDVIEQVREAIASICADPAGDYRGRGAVREVVVAGGAQDAHDAGDPDPGRAGGIDAAVWARAAETPDALALWADGRWWTYSELVRWAQGMATLLRERASGRGTGWRSACPAAPNTSGACWPCCGRAPSRSPSTRRRRASGADSSSSAAGCGP